jgi:hypothetical protein
MAKKKRDILTAPLPMGHNDQGIVLAMLPEPDRGCVLIAAEFLSLQLERLLRVHFLENGADDELQSQLLDSFNAPIFSFGVRSGVARAVGLISPMTYEVLEAVREIRNKCAHRTGPIELDDIEVAKSVRTLGELVELWSTNPFFDWLTSEITWGELKEYAEKPPQFSPQRITFMSVVMCLYIRLGVDFGVIRPRVLEKANESSFPLGLIRRQDINRAPRLKSEFSPRLC